MLRRFKISAGFTIVIGLFWSAPASAYLDPGTGSFILQSILGGIAGVLVAGKLYWHRFKAFFSSTVRDKRDKSGDG